MKILGRTFVEAKAMFEKDEIPQGIYEDILRAMGYAISVSVLDNSTMTEADITLSAEAVDTFNGLFGGDMYLVETDEDLKQVSTGVTIEEANIKDARPNGWASIIDVAAPFDICEYLPSGDFIVANMCWNDAGGNIFYIPSHFADKYPTIKGCMQATGAFWN